MAKTKKIKYKQADGTLSDYIHIGADASNIDLEEGINLEELNKKIVRVENSILKTSDGIIINPVTKVESITDNTGKALSDILAASYIQYESLPEPSFELNNKIVQYTGETDSEKDIYTGYFYKCILISTLDGEGNEAEQYIWQNIQVQAGQVLTFDNTPTEGSQNPVTSEGIKNYVDNNVPDVDLSNYYTKTETDDLLNNIDLSNYYNKTEIDTMLGDIETLLASI